jgi:hypothetical protein
MTEEIITEKEDIHNGIDFLKPDEKLKPISKRITSEFKTFDVLKENTKKSYKYTLNCIHYYYTGYKLTNEDDIIKMIFGLPYKKANITKMFKYLKNDKYVYDIVVRFKSRLPLIYGIFTHIRGFTPFIKKIFPYSKQYNIDYQDGRFNKTIDENLINLLSFNKKDILDRIENYEKERDELIRYSKPLSNNEILIYLLLTLMPTRRAYDFERTKIIDKVPDKDIDRSFNYYYDKHIYIYDTKNKTDYVMLLPDEIIPYIDISRKYLFSNSIKQLTPFIPKVFNKLYGHPYTAREIRKLYATYSNNTQFSMRERFANAAAMGHSMEENLRYSYK